MMNEAKTAVLLIEDNPGDAKLIEMMLAEAKGIHFEVTWRDNLSCGINCLAAHDFDVVLLDLGLPESSGLESLERLFSQAQRVPALVILSGLADETVAFQAVKAGAQDYLVKGKVDAALLTRSIRYAIERRQSEEALRQAHSQLEQRVTERTAELASTIEALHGEIVERKQAEDRIRHMAHHDALTELPNRVLLQDRLHQMLLHAQRRLLKVAVLFIDLDYFKDINDTLGHYIGDTILQTTAMRLKTCLREGDNVARLGGDEFVILLPFLRDGSDAALVAQKALDVLAQPFYADGHELHVTGSIGISLYPDDGMDVETLMRTADTAMYHAKDMRRGNFQFFTPMLNHAAQQRMLVSSNLRQALARNEFVLHYQPQVNMVDGVTFATEALLRWRRDGARPISCGDFIGNAEESGLIVSIGEWVLRQACKQLKIWHDAGNPQLKMAVNLSPRQLEQADFCAMVKDILAEANLPATALELEITENALMQRSEFTLASLVRLSEMGVQLSVDDFGTGYSNLAYLQHFPVHALKIDQSFVRGIGINSYDTALVTAVIWIAKSLHLKVLAEGVETVQQKEFLVSQGCLDAQGFYYSGAVPAEILPSMLHKPWQEIFQSQA